MSEIIAFNGEKILVDQCDYEKLSKYNWHISNGYACRSITTLNGSRKVFMHRDIMGNPLKFEVDHIDHNKLNNQKSNLRICSHAENSHNAQPHKDNSCSFFKGVYRKRKKWAAKITFNKKQIYIGVFNSEENASEAYNKMAKQLFGDFAFINKHEPVTNL